MSGQDFSDAYGKLNLAQRDAVDSIEGPVMVIAGPGTGKTQILALRIANILQKTDAAPENILALTFTESGARAMRERLLRYIGSEAYRVAIHTFHGFSEMLIRQYPDHYTRVIGARPASDLEKFRFVEQILDGGSFKHIRPLGDPLYYVSSIIRTIATLKQEYITPDGLAKLLEKEMKALEALPRVHEKGAHKGKVRSEYQQKEKSIEKNKELLHVYRAYEALLQSERRYDFEDMLLESVRALETSEDMLRDLEETYQYILADEHQDVNGTQNKILELLTSYHESPNLFVVGDEKQAVYRFQGASLENFLYFGDVYPNTKIITLTKNYRSTQAILDGAHSFIHVDAGPQKELRVPLTGRPGGVKMTCTSFSHEAVENEEVTKAIRALLVKGVLPEKIAVIVRTNREVESFSERIRKEGIAVSASADSDILAHPITASILALMEAIAKPESEAALFRVLVSPYWNISPGDLVRVLSARSYDRSLIAIIENETVLSELGVLELDSILRVRRVLQHVADLTVTTLPHQVLEHALTESGFLRHVVAKDPFEGVRIVRRIYDEIEELVKRDAVLTMREICETFSLRKTHNLPLSAPFITTNTHAIQVMTAHKSKGLEFDHVFVPHLVDSVWGGGRKVEHFKIPLTRHLNADLFDPFDDERRLLYVAMTRARETLHLSFSDTNADGRIFVPSRLLEYISPECIELRDRPDEIPDLALSLSPAPKMPVLDPGVLRTLFLARGLSATSLNNYLKNPWDYFFKNLLRIPETQSETLQFGTAMHGVLQSATAYFTKTRMLPDSNEIKLLLERELGKLPLTTEAFTRLHTKGFAALVPYLAHIESSLPVGGTKEEFRIRVTLKTGLEEIPEVPLTGMLDRLDFSGEGTLIRVLDYKTGKPKTRGYIDGKTKDSDGGYKRQLVFYALLLSLYGDTRYLSREFVLSFIEADQKGIIHEEFYTITDDEMEELKQEIIRIASEIASGAFLNAPLAAESAYADYVTAFMPNSEELRLGQ